MTHLPNILTVTRILLTFIFLFYITRVGMIAMIMAAVVFALAAVTDFLDGFIARKYQLVSAFGKLMDPIADKFLILAAFGMFAHLELVAWWMVALIAAREIILTVIRLHGLTQGKVMAAERAGKYKTVAQIVTIGLVLAFLIIRAAGLNTGPLSCLWRYAIDVGMLVTVILTVSSGVMYLWNNRNESVY